MGPSGLPNKALQQTRSATPSMNAALAAEGQCYADVCVSQQFAGPGRGR
jgi:hypothetical protein